MDIKKYLDEKWGRIYNFDRYTSITLVDEYTKNENRYMLLKLGMISHYETLKSDEYVFEGLFTDLKINGIDINIKSKNKLPLQYNFVYKRCCDFRLFDKNSNYMTFNCYSLFDIASTLGEDTIRKISYGGIESRRTISSILKRLEREFIEEVSKENLIDNVDTIEYSFYNIFVECGDTIPAFEYA